MLKFCLNSGFGRCARAALLALTLAILAPAPLPAQTDGERVTEVEARKALINKPEAEYPPAARQFKITGDVVLQITVSPDGKVASVDDAKGNPILRASAVSAIRKWTFKPRDSKMRTTMTFSFGFK